ncbi:MAG: c-type cytochrome [Acidimicrobiia bacterium]
MSSSLVITLAVVGGVAWLAFLGVSALRSRGKEEIAPNQASGRTDEELETRRLERVQQGAVLFAGFLAVSLPLYFLGEGQRQESFVEQFSEESISRGEHLVDEFGCFDCHGPGGSGGTASYIEKRTGVTTQWNVPSLDDIFYRYEPEEVNYWVTFGRPNTPMPAWGLAGGGAMNENQVQDIVNYLQSIQIGQQDALARVGSRISGENQRLENAEALMADTIIRQEQLVATIEAAPAIADRAAALTEAMRETLDQAATGIDTDGDGLSDVSETELNQLTAEFASIWGVAGMEAMSFDPANSQTNDLPDLDVFEQLMSAINAQVATNPILTTTVDRMETAMAAPGEDADGDGISDSAEAAITSLLSEALGAVRPLGLTVLNLDPANPATSGDRDLIVAERAVSANESVSLQQVVTRDNQEQLLGDARNSLDALRTAADGEKFRIDIEGVAAAGFDGNGEAAARAVYLFNAYCARCHTAGWSAGLPFTQEAGSGALGPALWEGRPNVQFLSEEALVEFITEGSSAAEAYGVNGIGSGRMPAFGRVLSVEDIGLIATYLRSGNLTGLEASEQ